MPPSNHSGNAERAQESPPLEVLLDFRAAKTDNRTTKALSANVIDYNGEKILKSIGLFGANASGKSNILKAIDLCQGIILKSHEYNEGKTFGFVPFKFEGYENKPSTFSVDFVHDNIEYEYSFTLTKTEILKESLHFYPTGRRKKVYSRDETKGPVKQDVYSFSDRLIPRPLDVAINTSRKTLYLSRASQMDRELCRKLYLFFMFLFGIEFAPLDFRKLKFDSAKEFSENKDFFLYALSICDSDISEIKLTTEMARFDGKYKHDGTIKADGTVNKFETFHKAAPSIPFDLFREESSGTKQLFSMLFYLL